MWWKLFQKDISDFVVSKICNYAYKIDHYSAKNGVNRVWFSALSSEFCSEYYHYNLGLEMSHSICCNYKKSWVYSTMPS